MSMALTNDGCAKLVTVSGEIDMSNAHLLTELVEFVCGTPLRRLALDLSKVRFFSAHGVSALLQARDIAADAGAGAGLILRDPAPCVTYILATTGALPSFEVTRGVAPRAPTNEPGQVHGSYPGRCCGTASSHGWSTAGPAR
jgi:anti-sigma B factor antagonist